MADDVPRRRPVQALSAREREQEAEADVDDQMFKVLALWAQYMLANLTWQPMPSDEPVIFVHEQGTFQMHAWA